MTPHNPVYFLDNEDLANEPGASQWAEYRMRVRHTRTHTRNVVPPGSSRYVLLCCSVLHRRAGEYMAMKFLPPPPPLQPRTKLFRPYLPLPFIAPIVVKAQPMTLLRYYNPRPQETTVLLSTVLKTTKPRKKQHTEKPHY